MKKTILSEIWKGQLNENVVKKKYSEKRYIQYSELAY